jgi:hypothetical protein
MIHCIKCQSPNQPDSVKCQQCNADLLPGDRLLDRLGTLVAGFITATIAFLLAVVSDRLFEEVPDCLPASPTVWLFVAGVSLLTAIVGVVRKTPLHVRYAKRARRHVELDPEQALMDFSAALESAPEKQRASLLQERAALYERLGKDSRAVKDRLDYTFEDSAYQTGAGLAYLVGADQETYVNSVAQRERRKMIAEGKISAVGFCRKCGKPVELTPDLRCKEHPSIKGDEVQYGLPEAVKELTSKALQEYEAKKKKRRRWLIVFIVFVGIPLLLCLLSVILVQVLPDEWIATKTPSFEAIPTSLPSTMLVVAFMMNSERFPRVCRTHESKPMRSYLSPP